MYFIVNAVNLWAFVGHSNVLGQTVPNRTLVKGSDRIGYPENLACLTKKILIFRTLFWNKLNKLSWMAINIPWKS